MGGNVRLHLSEGESGGPKADADQVAKEMKVLTLTLRISLQFVLDVNPIPVSVSVYLFCHLHILHIIQNKIRQGDTKKAVLIDMCLP